MADVFGCVPVKGMRVSFNYHKAGVMQNRRGIVEYCTDKLLCIKDETRNNDFRAFHIKRIGRFQWY